MPLLNHVETLRAGQHAPSGLSTVTYSDRGRLASAKKGTTITNYAYNGLGHRVRRVKKSCCSLLVPRTVGKILSL
ncbi:hypothetical protein [Methyloglobulus sp.]|uniref:hypothetical protein n=1 Tax=Methyloglobulus sp. TaxID=2518622 RepID=UPI0032B748F0